MHQSDGKVILNFSRRVLTGHPLSPRTPDIPGLTEAQAEALDAVHYIAKAHKLNFTTVKGEMRFVNNFAILHGREAYRDADDLGKSKRHLLRLWLHNEQMMWKLPPALKLVWARTFYDEERHKTWERYDLDKFATRTEPGSGFRQQSADPGVIIFSPCD